MRFFWFLFLLFMLAPLGALFFGDTPKDEISTVPVLMQEAIYNTVFLAIGAGLLSTLLGAITAWSVTYYPLVGRVFLQKAFYLPLVFPAYVFAFIFLGTLNNTILLQGQLWALVVVMSLALFPYVYIFTCSALVGISKNDWEANEVMGRSFSFFLRRVVVPKIAPLLLSAIVLVLFETLADFGAASILNVPVITTLIYKLWYDLFSFAAAAQLSIHYLAVIVILLMFEKLIKRENSAGYQLELQRQNKKIPLWINFLLSFFCWFIVAIAVVFPIGQTIYWFMDGYSEKQVLETIEAFMKTIGLAIFCGGVVALSAVALSYFLRFTKQSLSNWESVATIGYSIPGSILAVAVFSLGLIIFTKISTWISFILLIFGLSYKFFPVGLRAVGGRLSQISTKMDEFSETVGASFAKTFWRLHWPILIKAIIVSTVLVAIEVMKEMPMTLMLAPSGFNTLSIQIFNFTSEGEWEKAAVPGLFLILAGFISIALLFLGHDRERHGNS